MVKLTIDHIPVEVPDGISVMEAAATLGITIPSMCWKPGFSNHPSCMVCLVKEVDKDHLVPSCAMPVSEGMHILTGTPEVMEARKEAIELLLSDHVGDCEAPCRLSCPAFMDIPLMNRLIASGDFEQALRIVHQEIALPYILGYICPAPCEKACKRKPIDQAVSICLLKRSAAQYGALGKPRIQVILPNQQGSANPAMPSAAQSEVLLLPEQTELQKSSGKKVAIIGTGPAGLSAAFYLLKAGHHVVLFDRNEQAGGAMRYNIPDDQLPKVILDEEIDVIRKMGAGFRLGITVTRELFRETILREYDAVILAAGSLHPHSMDVFELQPDENGSFVDKKHLTTSIPGVFACGHAIREQKMAVQSVAHGKMAALQVDIYLAASNSQEGTVHLKPPASTAKAEDGFRKFRHKSVSTIGHLEEPEFKEYLKESVPYHRNEPAGGTLEGFTREEAIREARRCMRCDCRKPLSCKLRLYADAYDAGRKRFAGPDRSLITKSIQHDLVVYETEKCIRCGLCVDITQRNGESIGLTFAGRGFDVRILAPFSETIREALTKTAAECAESCPTGALALKSREERNSS
jgi:NADPH-dependent glutamate synthase beta subunit-like oxidoreductase